MAGLLLDTCAIIWIAASQEITDDALTALSQAVAQNDPIHLSPITAWELGLLVSRGRLSSTATEKAILQVILAQPGVSYANMSPDVLIDASYLPANPPNDPADRIIIATARAYDLTVVTRDRLILSYAREGHVKALAC